MLFLIVLIHVNGDGDWDSDAIVVVQEYSKIRPASEITGSAICGYKSYLHTDIHTRIHAKMSSEVEETLERVQSLEGVKDVLLNHVTINEQIDLWQPQRAVLFAKCKSMTARDSLVMAVTNKVSSKLVNIVALNLIGS